MNTSMIIDKILNIRLHTFLLFISTGLILFLPVTYISPLEVSSIPNITIYTYSITNTTVSQRLYEDSDDVSYLGRTWNISISLNTNSTTNINFTFGATYYSKWEGPKSFTLIPGATIHAIYVQHFVTDAVGHWWLDYSLSNSSKHGSGIFTIQMTNPGYYVYHGLGEVYASNITAWLETGRNSKSTSDTTPITNSSTMTTDTTKTTTTATPVRFMTIVLGITIIFVRRRKGRI